jgi:hypothetical protein
MRFDRVEIYSDKTGNAVLRHPERDLPGALIEGRDLHALCTAADAVCDKAGGVLDARAMAELTALRNSLWAYFNHYRDVLNVHGIVPPGEAR